ncbi:MAG: methyltransferase domain-containing protein [Candidatus Micrarchaeota archaeon]|nr:methyltransferase domain-containing protein [Candidatus Micrarchaeota archaeon]
MKDATYEMTRRSHDRLAKIWINQPSYFDKSLKDAHTKRFLAHLRKGALVLDAGCGLGKEAKLLLQNGLRVISIDISKGMLKEARKLVPNGDFRYMDMTRLSFKDETFDAVWCFSSIHHLRKAEAAKVMKELNHVLKPNGILTIAAKEGKGWYYNVTRQDGKALKRFIKSYTVSSMSEMLADNGFKLLDIRVQRSKIRPDWARVVAVARKSKGRQ